MMAMAQAGTLTRESAFLELYDREASTVLRYLRTASVSGSDVEDLCAETFSRAWGAWSRFKGVDAEARAWLLRIARNAAIDAGRRRHGVRVVPIDDYRADPSPGPESQAVDRVQLRSALAAIKPEERDLLALRAAGLSHAEIAAVTGRSEAATKMAWHRAVERLRPHLERTA